MVFSNSSFLVLKRFGEEQLVSKCGVTLVLLPVNGEGDEKSSKENEGRIKGDV